MAGTRKRKSKAIGTRATTESGTKDVEKAHKWSWLLFLFCLPQRPTHRRRRNNRNGSRRVVLTPYSQPEIARVPMPPQLRHRPRSVLLAQTPSEARVWKRHSRLMPTSESAQDELEHLFQHPSSAAVPVAANNPVKRLSSTSRHSSLARSESSQPSSPIPRMRLEATKGRHLSLDLTTTGVLPSSIKPTPSQKDSTCQESQTEQVIHCALEPSFSDRPRDVEKAVALHEGETPLILEAPATPATPLTTANPATPMTRPVTAMSEESRLSMASSKFSLTTFPLPPSQLPPLPSIPIRRPASEASLYPRSEASLYSRSSLAHSIRSSIMSRPQSIYRKAVKALPKNPQYFLDILDEHMDVPPPVPLKVRPSSTKTTRTFNTAVTPAPSGPPPPIPSTPRATTPPNLRIHTSFEEQPSPNWDVAWEDFDTILDDWDDTRSTAERPSSQITSGSDFQSKSSVTGDYLHIVERIRSESASPTTSMSSGPPISPSSINKALPPPPISQLPELDPDSSTEGDPWSPRSESQPATPSLRTLLKKRSMQYKSQSSLSKSAMPPPPRSHFHIAHCILEPPPRNPARKTNHQMSSSLDSSIAPSMHVSARTSAPMGNDHRRIASYAPSSLSGRIDLAHERQFEGVSFSHARSKTPSPTASVIPGLEGGYF